MNVDGSAERPVGTANPRVLLLARSFDAGGPAVCSHLAAHGLGRDDALVFVLGGGTPDDRLESLRAHVDGPLPSRVGFLTFEEGHRSAEPAHDVEGGDVWVGTASSPGNLTDVGVALSTQLSRWGGRGGEVAVCVEPVTTLLQYSSVSDVYRFMHVVGQQVGGAGGRVHYHLDPTAHDGMVVNQLKTVCDAVVELDEDGDVHVRTRR